MNNRANLMNRLSSAVMLSWGTRRVLLTLAAGAVGALALPPFNIFAAMFVSFTFLVWLLDGDAAQPDAGLVARFRPAFITGWLFGFGYFTAGLWWLGNALLEDGGTFAWAIPLAAMGLPAFLAIFYGFATTFAQMFWSQGIGRIAALAVAFGLFEWLRSFVFTGFPWNAVGYAAMPIPLLMQPVHLIGIAGMNLLAVFVFAMPALLGTGRHAVAGITTAAVLIIADLGYGYWVLQQDHATAAEESPVTVRIVQPVHALDSVISDSDRAAMFEELLKLSSEHLQDETEPADIIVWPETAIPFILSQNQSAFTRIDETLTEGQVLLAGAVRAEDGAPGMPRRYYNSVYAFGGDGEIIGAADKVHLVPFGEYLPLENWLSRFGLRTIAASVGGYTAAASNSLITLGSGLSIYPLICYEAIFPAEITEEGQRADILLNVTNDLWFGRTPGPYQHFHAARVTAVEVGKPMIRAANSGISAVIDARGNIISGATTHTKGIVFATIPRNSVLSWDNETRKLNFWLLSAIILGCALFSRISFNSDYN